MRASVNRIRSLMAAVAISVAASLAAQDSRAAGSLADIWVSFKLDPRITQGLYMGDRWVSPPTYTRVDEASGITIDVRVIGIDAQHKQRAIDAAWSVADPALATVSTVKATEARITVHKEGQSDLIVTSDNVSKKMVIKCAQQDGVWRVDISQ
jgi:hypothetical protein